MNFSRHANRKKVRKLNSPIEKTTKLIGTSFIRIMVFGVVLLAVGGVAAGLGIANAIFDSAPELDFNDMVPEGYTSFIYNQNNEIVQELSTGDANRIYVELDQIPQHVQDAFIAIEDERFYEHNGIDMRGIFRAVFVNFSTGSMTGASTITQQVIKNNVLSTEKSYERKIQEQYLAVQAEKVLSKDEILELYLNTAGLGRGTNGVQAASKRYFNKDVNELSIAEAAVIAGITQRPTYYDPVINPNNNKEKQRLILSYMKTQGYINDTEYQTALAEDVYSNIQVVNQEFEAQSDYSYFVDEVIRGVADDLERQKGYSGNQAVNLIFRGGLSIFLTQDADMQKILDDAFTNEENFPTFEDDYDAMLQYSLSLQTADGVKHFYEEAVLPSDEAAVAHMDVLKSEWMSEGDEILNETHYIIPEPQSAMVIIDYYTGHVKAMVGGRGEKVGNQTRNRVTQALRQPGSTFKVLAAYLPAIDTMGFTLADVYDDAPYTIQIGGQEPYSPRNWYDNERSEFNFWGLNTIREGIQWSINLLAIQTMADIGIQTGWDYLMDLGFTTLVDRREINNQIFTDKNIVLPLGGLTDGVPLLELTAAYGAIANKGVYVEPIFYTKVLSHDGSILLNNEPESHTVMKETTAFLLTDSMEDVVRAGTGTAARFDNMSIAGKTGTTSDAKDLIFVGYTPYYVAGIWLGHDVPQEMDHNRSYQKYLWADVMAQIHEGFEDKEFPMPEGLVRKAICTESGKIPIEGLCDEDPRGTTVRYEYFVKGTEPTETCDVHVKAVVCADTYLLPSEFCPESTHIERVFTSRVEPLLPETWDPENPPRIKDWQYELPANTPDEYCTFHTAESVAPTLELDADGNPIVNDGEATEEPTPPVIIDED